MFNFKLFLNEKRDPSKQIYGGSYNNPINSSFSPENDFDADWEHADNFDNSHFDMIRDYKKGHIINDVLRDNRGETKHFPDELKSLDYVTSARTKKPITVYRGFHYVRSRHDSPDLVNIRRGRILHDRGYTGTSLDPALAIKHGQLYQGQPHIAQIHVPANTKGFYIEPFSPFSPAFFSNEKEFLFHRGTKFRVIGHSVRFSKNDTKPIHVVHMIVHSQENHNGDV